MVTTPSRPQLLNEISLDRHLVIEASAGTGKTYTLEHLVIALVIERACPIEQILVVTYTEKAAAELRRRLKGRLSSLCDDTGMDASVKERLSVASRSFEGAAISTIHAFCQRVAAENAFLSSRLLEQEMTDARSAFGCAFTETVRKNLARDQDSQALLGVWLETRSLADLEDLLFRCHSQRAAIRPSLPVDGVEGTAEHILSSPGLDLERMQSALKDARVHGRTIKAIVDRLSELRRILELSREKTSRSALELSIRIAREEKSRRFLPYLHSTLSKLEEHPSSSALCAEALADLRTTLTDLSAAVIPAEAIVAQVFLPPIVATLRREKLERGRFDFDDMISSVAESLGGPHGARVAARIRARFRYALIDEFQDTDEMQWSIFRRIFVDAPSQCVLTVIGDPKQAIYGFRGADVHTYFLARDHLCRSGGHIAYLLECHRSTPALVEALHLILGAESKPSLFTGRIRYDHPVRCASIDLAFEVPAAISTPIHVFEVAGSGGAPWVAADVKAALGMRIAKEIASLIGRARFGQRPSLAPLRASDVFVLTRTLEEGSDLGEHLGRAGVPYAFYKQEGLFQTREASHIRSLLSAIADPDRRAVRLRAWISPFFDIALEDLPKCADLPRDHPLVERLHAWKALADTREFDRLFASIARDSGFVERRLFFGDRKRDLTNTLHIFEILEEEAIRSRCTLQDLVLKLDAFMRGRALPRGENGNLQRPQSDEDSVQIMTIHKAKGLEAPVVFLVGGYYEMQGNLHTYHEGDQRVLHVGASPDPAALREEEEEDERLIYVALTRAKGRIYLPHFDESARRLTGCYAKLNAALTHALASDPRDTPLFSREILIASPRSIDEADSESCDGARALSAWEPPAELLDRLDPNLAIVEHARVRQSATRITSYSKLKTERGGHHPGAETDVSISLEMDVETAGEDLDALPGGTAAGRLMHEILENVPIESFFRNPTFEPWSTDPGVTEPVKIAIRRYQAIGMGKKSAKPRNPQALFERCLELLHTAYTSPLQLGDRILSGGIHRAENISRELEFLYPVPPVGRDRTFVKGFIDLVFVVRGRVYIADWKTDRLPIYRGDSLRQHVVTNYALQAEIYALAITKLFGLDAPSAYNDRFGGVVYAFLRGMNQDGQDGVHFARPSWEEITQP